MITKNKSTDKNKQADKDSADFSLIASAAYLIAISLILILISGCSGQDQQSDDDGGKDNKDASVSRYDKIPSSAVKVTPEADVSPPKSHSDEYKDPVPIPNIDSAGAEDSPFIMPDGNILYLFFTPDVDVPVEKQIVDGVTGIYSSKKTGGVWSEPERIMLQDRGKISGDGCEFVQGNMMWFCSVREGYAGVHWFTAEFKDGRWQDWKNADKELMADEYKTGELHMSSGGSELYFHSDRPGGKGGLDIWVSKKIDGAWPEPENIDAVNTEGSEGWPALSPDEDELWISKDYGLWRSKKTGDKWSKPELMISPLAGEASIDDEGNVYFTHHFYKDNKMIEADIYFAERK